jgi:hypothetical protein
VFRRLIAWALDSPLIVILLAVALAGFGGFAFFTINMEAHPDPAPAIIRGGGPVPRRLGRKNLPGITPEPGGRSRSASRPWDAAQHRPPHR